MPRMERVRRLCCGPAGSATAALELCEERVDGREEPDGAGHRPPVFHSIKLFVLCHGMLQCAQLLYSAYFKSSITTIEKQFGMSSFSSGILSSMHEVGNSVLIIFVSYFGSRVHRPKLIGLGGLLLSAGTFLLTLPHYIFEPYQYSKTIVGNTSHFNTDTCQPMNQTHQLEFCTRSDHKFKKMGSVWGIMVIAQLMVGIGTVPIQPFGISYVDDFAEPSNAPLYIATIDMKPSDPRWIGAWWLGLLISSGVLAVISIPYFFFPRQMIHQKKSISKSDILSEMEEQKMEKITNQEFIKIFPKMLLKMLLNPLFILVVLAECCFSSVLAGLSTYLNKFLESQFSITTSTANLLIGSITLPAVAIGMLLGGVYMKHSNLPLVKIPWYTGCVLIISVVLTVPLFFLGCSTQKIAGINYNQDVNRSSSFGLKTDCNAHCFCFDSTYHPVCGSDAVEYISPCQAGCSHSVFNYTTRRILTYNNCSCIQTPLKEDYAVPGHCKVSCSYLLLSVVFSLSFIGLTASLTHNPLYMLVLRLVRHEEKSFAIGIQFLLMKVFAWLPAPALFGAVIDSACIRWGIMCNGKRGACSYYDNDLLRNRYLGLQVGYNILGVLVLLITGWKVRKIGGQQNTGPV
ncbi:solute carrier organic anion transporter family member 2A1-like isoform X2 [Pristis pectinata]|uniref:solute carrier organic anion transporter family member 2A1-like isoform X2 n=1 Tax=Pristis pectinata TaxID=685728 RepID=UPI00223CCE1F|nr:solute carrier organic anion transporter family member 2A1-like isoform X2 [Pristis pectinata]